MTSAWGDALPDVCHETHGNYQRATEHQLVQWLVHRRLPVEGTKEELVARLRADDRAPTRACTCCPRHVLGCESSCPQPLPSPVTNTGGTRKETARTLNSGAEIQGNSDVEQRACGATVTAAQFHRICERLRDVKLHVGPNSRAQLEHDHWLRLSGGERSSIVETVLDCLGIEVAG